MRFVEKSQHFIQCVHDQFLTYFSRPLILYRSIESPEKKKVEKEKRKLQSRTLPVTDADMVKAGTSFLDAIEKSLGLGCVLITSDLRQKKPSLFRLHLVLHFVVFQQLSPRRGRYSIWQAPSKNSKPQQHRLVNP